MLLRLLQAIMLFNGFFILKAQNNDKDSIQHYNKLDEVIVVSSGQHSSQSIKKSVYQVNSIQQKDIEALAANDLTDVMRQNLNLSFSNNLSNGKSKLSLFGLDGKYVKVLVDNIPLVNDEGFGNETDLNEINLDDVKQIEIVEGAMAVEYGSNAVTGVVNIITKKKVKDDLKVTVTAHEETVGDEYSLFVKGKHIQSAKLMSNVSDNLFLSLNYNHTDYKGYFKDHKGRLYINDDKKRGHHWLPREQHTGSLLLNYEFNNKLKMFYKLSYFDQNLYNYSKKVIVNLDGIKGVTNPYSTDNIFNTIRIYNHLNANYKVTENGFLDLSVSYQNQKRKQKEYTFYIKSKKEDNIKNTTQSQIAVLYSKLTYSGELASKKIKYQLGTELDFSEGTLSDLSINDISKYSRTETIKNYDAFGFLEYHINDKFSLRSGIRGLFSDFFTRKMAFNFSGKYLFDDDLEARFIVGTAPRNPNFNELYFEFIDANHNFISNKDLKPENAYSFNVNLRKTLPISESIAMIPKFTLQYINISDRIEQAQIEDIDGRPAFQSINIDKYKAWSLSLGNKINFFQNLNLDFGIMYLATSKEKHTIDYNDDYLHNLQMNTNLSIDIPKIDLTISGNYKYTGSQYTFVKDDKGKFVRGIHNPYKWLNCSLKKHFLNKKVTAIFGIRNLFDVTHITSNFKLRDAHGIAVNNAKEIAYGRSYFLKLNYNIF